MQVHLFYHDDDYDDKSRGRWKRKDEVNQKNMFTLVFSVLQADGGY